MSDSASSLIIEMRSGECLQVSSGADVSIELIHKSGQLARLRVTAPRDVKIVKIDNSRTKHGNVVT